MLSYLHSSRDHLLLFWNATRHPSHYYYFFEHPDIMNSTSGSRPFPPGIHVPSLTWFDNDKTQEIAWDVQTKHIEFLVKSGLHGS